MILYLFLVAKGCMNNEIENWFSVNGICIPSYILHVGIETSQFKVIPSVHTYKALLPCVLI